MSVLIILSTLLNKSEDPIFFPLYTKLIYLFPFKFFLPIVLKKLSKSSSTDKQTSKSNLKTFPYAVSKVISFYFVPIKLNTSLTTTFGEELFLKNFSTLVLSPNFNFDVL